MPEVVPIPSNDLPADPDAGGFLPPPNPLEGTGITRAINPINASESPAFQQFLRRQRSNAAAARKAIAEQRETLELRRDRRLEDLGVQEGRGLRSIAENFEARGLFNSGRRHSDQRDFAGDVERDRSRFLFDIGKLFTDLDERESKIGAGSAAARQRALARIGRQLAEQMARSGIIPDLSRRS